MRVRYITYREEDEFGRLCFYILQKDFPHYIGLLVTQPMNRAMINMPLPEYHLWLTYAGVLMGNYVPSTVASEANIDGIFSDMAEWYYLNRIKTQAKKYSKFKITHDNISHRQSDN